MVSLRDPWWAQLDYRDGPLGSKRAVFLTNVSEITDLSKICLLEILNTYLSIIKMHLFNLPFGSICDAILSEGKLPSLKVDYFLNPKYTCC
jgi:hypothetical protein